MMRELKIYAEYILKILTKPIGTTFEIRGERLNRVQFVYRTVKMLRVVFNK